MGSVSLGLLVAACNAHCGWIINRRGVCVVAFALALTIISTSQNPEMDTQSSRQIEIAKKVKGVNSATGALQSEKNQDNLHEWSKSSFRTSRSIGEISIKAMNSLSSEEQT
jgi:hypothetical protein